MVICVKSAELRNVAVEFFIFNSSVHKKNA